MSQSEPIRSPLRRRISPQEKALMLYSTWAFPGERSLDVAFNFNVMIVAQARHVARYFSLALRSLFASSESESFVP